MGGEGRFVGQGETTLRSAANHGDQWKLTSGKLGFDGGGTEATADRRHHISAIDKILPISASKDKLSHLALN
jgi:hypothetical protein